MLRLPTLLLLTSCAAPMAQTPPASSNPPPGRYERNLESAGRTRSYVLRVPEAAAKNEPLPLIVALHGFTSTAAGMEGYTKIGDDGTQRGYLVAFPNGLGKNQGWNVDWIDLSGQRQDDAQFVMDVVDSVSREAKVDPKRVYVCGHSNGGFLTHLVATRFPDRIAAGGVVAGTIGAGGKQIPTPKAPVSMLLIHGRKDPTVTYDQLFKGLLKGVSAPEAAQFWAGALREPKKTVTDQDGIETIVWQGDGKEVELVSLAEGTHAWPGAPGDPTGWSATKALLDFFDAHKR